MDKLTKCKTCGGEGVLENCDGTHTEKCVTCDGAGFLEDLEGQISNVEKIMASQVWPEHLRSEMERKLKQLKELLG